MFGDVAFDAAYAYDDFVSFEEQYLALCEAVKCGKVVCDFGEENKDMKPDSRLSFVFKKETPRRLIS